MEKIKLRISSFLLLIIENDAQRFGFVRSNNHPNINGLVNKLIPNLLRFRQYRREEIKKLLLELGRSNAEEIYESVNYVIDQVYFSNADINTLDTEIWILPTKQSEVFFEEILESEIKIMASNVSAYIRGLLNEYSLLPQYKREELTFLDEIKLIQSTSSTGQILHFEIDNNKYSFFPFNHMYGFLYDQTNYLIGYDIKRKQIRSFPIAEMHKLYALQSKFKPSKHLINRLQEYLETYNYSKDNIVDYGENYEN